MTDPTIKTTLAGTNGTTGYSSIPNNYDEYMKVRDSEQVFGRRHSDPDLDLSAPYGTVDTKAFSTADKLWGGTIGLEPDPKLAKPLPDEYLKHNVTYGAVGTTFPEDWRATETGWHHSTGPTFVTKSPNVIPAGAASSVAMKFDSGKTDWSLMPFEAIEEINKVLDFGAKKYAAHNWRTGSGFKYTRVLSSLLRHTFAWARGEDLDPESGLSHLAHMGCNVVFLIYYNKYNVRYSNDDRVTR